jgi:small subunit ribosomal protein S6
VREYEFVYVIQPDAAAERETEIHQRIDQVISDHKARLLLRDDWGKRRLAYEIKKFQKGHYFQVNFLGAGKEVSEIERLMRIDPDVLRYLSVQTNDEVKDIEKRAAEAATQAAEQARRRAEREKERAEREEREKERERSGGGPGPMLDDDDDDGPRFRADDGGGRFRDDGPGRYRDDMDEE